MAGFDRIYGPNDIGGPATGTNQYVTYSQIRERLTANRTYYVRTDGSNSNNGLSDSAAGAFLTLLYAVNAALALDAAGFNVTIQIRSGTFAGADIFAPIFGLGTSGTFLITGDTTTPTNVVITSSANGNSIGVFYGAVVSISGLSLTPTATFVCLQAGNGASVQCTDKMDFGGALYHLEAQQGGSIAASGISYTISGSPSVAHVRPNNLGYIDTSFSTMTLTANIACTQFALSELNSVYKCNNMTFTLGAFAVTGSKYTVKNNAVINTNTANINYFPGSTPGTGTNSGVAPWGLYL